LVIKHVTKRMRRHWPKTRIVWRGDDHYGRVEAMEWVANVGLRFRPAVARRSGLPGTRLRADMDCSPGRTAWRLWRRLGLL
jgi:hypothetical protein